MGVTTNKVEICNLALAEINQRLITSLDAGDDSPQQTYCKLVYEQARRNLLAMYDWSFALAREKLTPVQVYTTNTDLLEASPEIYTNDFFGWYSKYKLPAGCLKISAVYDSNWKRVVNSRGLAMPWFKQGEYICSKESYYNNGTEVTLPTLYLQYVANIEDVNYFSPAFCEVFALAIAKKLTKQFNNSSNFLQVLEMKFEKALKEAKMQDFRQTNTEGVSSYPLIAEMYGSI